ncbi:MAG: ABC transporter substrate-binding protein [Chloroflexota bacterium]|nr:ABC transporter substrate-binding protein [Chloroflexota bacterium]MDE3193116.1 ABC transporter substrate-binding protein [Chloroflexota bacterium]
MRRAASVTTLVLAVLVTACGPAAAPSAAPAASASAAASAAPSASPSKAPVAISIGYASVSGTQAAAWVAKEKGIFQKNGLDVTLESIAGGSSPTSALIADKIFALQISVEAISATLEGADIVYVAAPVSSPLFWFISGPNIKNGADLKGKKIAATGIGTATYFADVLALRHFGLATKDVDMVTANSVPGILAAIQSGQVAGGAVSMPTYSVAKKAGMTTLVNVADLGFKYPSSWLAVRRKTIESRPDVVAAVVKSISEAISVEIKDPATAEQIIGQYTKTKDQALLKETYDTLVPYLNKTPTPKAEQVGAALDLIALNDPKAKGADPTKFVDTKFVDDLQKSGFLDGLYK